MIEKRIVDLVPSHYKEYAPRFIKFLEKYYEWLYRSSGLSAGEVEELRNDTSWLDSDIDKFIVTGKLRYLAKDLDPNAVDDAIIDVNNSGKPGSQASTLSDDFVMERGYYGYATSDGETFSDANDSDIETDTVEENILDGWFRSMGFDRVKLGKINDVNQVLMLSLLKHIYAIKGTETAMKLFFNLFFDETVEIHQPKLDICYIDENFIVDGAKVLRDDEVYQEFSYIIKVSKDVASYEPIFTDVYLKNIHPSGFRVELVRI